MKADDNMRYIAIANLVDRKIVIEYAPKRDKLTKLQNSVKDIIEKLILISITANERHTESMNEELKILTVVDKSVRWCYIGNLIIFIFSHNFTKFSRKDRLSNVIRT
jgi:hypothetical protein